jgi:hypothetical protein
MKLLLYFFVVKLNNKDGIQNISLEDINEQL